MTKFYSIETLNIESPDSKGFYYLSPPTLETALLKCNISTFN